MLFRKKPVFIGLHFAKTGGTSIKSHVTRHLGKNETYAFGNFAHATRLLHGRPLLAELPRRQVGRIRFVYGHGVSSDTLQYFPNRDVTLFVICRDPFRRFISSFKQVARAHRKFGEKVNLREVYENQPANPFSHSMLRHFRGLVPDGVRDPKERLIEILKCFRFVMSTDDLNEHSRPFMEAIGVPQLRESKRVYPESVDLGDLTEDEVLARDDLDAFVNETVKAFHADRRTTADADATNPFGFDPAVLSERLARIVAEAPPRELEIEQRYKELFKFLDKRGRLEAAKTLADLGEMTPAAAAAFDSFCRETARKFDEQDLPSRNLCYQTEVFLRLKQPDEAAECARRAVEADPNNPMALFLAGRTALDLQRYEDGAASLEKAVALNPTHIAGFRYLAKAYTRLGRDADAAEALAAADRI